MRLDGIDGCLGDRGLIPESLSLLTQLDRFTVITQFTHEVDFSPIYGLTRLESLYVVANSCQSFVSSIAAQSKYLTSLEICGANVRSVRPCALTCDLRPQPTSAFSTKEAASCHFCWCIIMDMHTAILLVLK